jgi:ferric-dicitrate binding protein FerR (iron transport regulator)
MEQDHLLYLLEGYKQDALSTAEQEEWNAVWQDERQKDRIVQALHQSLDRQGIHHSFSANNADEQLRQILRMDQQVDRELLVKDLRSHNLRVVRRMQRTIMLVGAAAAVLFIICSLLFVIYSKRSTDTQLSSVIHPLSSKDVLPGREGAILTLANGEQIVLDTASNGTLRQERNSRIRKENGQLIYSRLTVDDSRLTVSPLTYNTISTPKGRQYQLVLSDGTRVWLNASSSIRFPAVFVGGERRVEVSGEAYFEAPPSPPTGGERGKLNPFIVQVNSLGGGGTEIAVLGTRFNVSAYEDEASITTTLLEGSVKVNLLDLRNEQGNKKRETRNGRLLSPGQQSQINLSAHTNKVEKTNVEQAIAWKNGFFQFNGNSIEDIMRQLTRWYDMEVVYEGPVPERAFTGKISRTLSLSKVLEVLELSNIHFQVEGKRIVVKA